MESVLLASIIFLLVVLILLVGRRKKCIKSVSVDKDGDGTDVKAPDVKAPNVVPGKNQVTEDDEKELQILAKRIQEKGCADEARKENLKSEIKKIITCQCADNPEFCRNQLKRDQDTVTAMESIFIDADIETPCLDKEYIEFENKVADIILKSGVDVCELERSNLQALGRYIDSIVEKVCGDSAYGYLKPPSKVDLI